MPAFALSGAKEEYSKWVASIYTFNLIVGTGALTLPHAFSQAGWLISLIVISAVAFMSYVTVTLVIESMAATNAILSWRKIHQNTRPGYELPNSSQNRSPPNETDEANFEEQIESDSNESNQKDASEESAPLLENSIPHRLPTITDYYSITNRVEMGEMISLYFKRVGVTLFYICICVYLYGDLAIYATAVAKSLRDVTCTISSDNSSSSNTSDLCWANVNVTRGGAYRLYLGLFLLLLGPFVFFNLQSTKHLQILTSALRWIAFFTMVILTIIHLARGDGAGKPQTANFLQLPELFGVGVYSFMCHHSLPSLVTPVNDKQHMQKLFAVNYFIVLSFYILLAMTGIFTFKTVYDLYTLNFQPNDHSSGTNIKFIAYFLSLFPVFTLSTNFPIIGITLRNNLQALLLPVNANYFLKHVVVPLITVLPPLLVSLITENIGILVGITGTYAGSGIQYIIPVVLAYRSRKLTSEVLGAGIKNSHASVFSSGWWLIFVIVWAISCVVLVSINNGMKIFQSNS